MLALDISADLTELGRTPVAVVCAGVKSILDIGRTLEYLETQGVTVASFGHSKEFPSFFSSESGFSAPYSVNTAKSAAEIIGEKYHWCWAFISWRGQRLDPFKINIQNVNGMSPSLNILILDSPL